MKRFFALLTLAFTLLICFVSCDHNDHNEHIGSERYHETGFTYSLHSDSYSTYAILEYYNGASDIVEIPSIYKGYPVKMIGSSAFEGRENITEVIIPNSVKTIGNFAFKDCSNLTSVSMPENLTTLGTDAFYGCKSLKSIVIPNGVTTIESCAFADCTALASVVFPENLIKISSYAFNGCESLTSIVIPDSVTTINYYAFSGCSSLKFNEYEGCKYLGNESNPYYALIDTVNDDQVSIKIHPNAKLISGVAFENCSLLESITIPDGVTYISADAFLNCNKLKFNIYESGKYLGNEDNPYYALIEMTHDSIFSLKIHPDTKIIVIISMAYRDKPNSIIIPENVIIINPYAFTTCMALQDIYYAGSRKDWEALNVPSDKINNATIHYDYVPEE